MKLFLFLITILCYTSCIKSNVFEKNNILKNNEWHYNEIPEVKFTITDTSANYLLYLTFKHFENYAYNNIWVKLYTKNPGETTATSSIIEIPLAMQSGRWLGRSFNNIVEHQMPLKNNGSYKFGKKGTYTLGIEQVMRNNPLKEVISVGIRVEKL